MSRVFILGAGASRFAGYPLGLDLWKFVRNSRTPGIKAKQNGQFVKPAMDQILRLLPQKEPERPNLEEIFTLLDLASRGTDLPGLAEFNWKVLRPCLIGMIIDVFLWHQYEFNNALAADSDHNSSRILAAWTALLQGEDTIITFNWDLLHEAALWHVHKWHYSDGYGFACADAPPRIHSPVKILKLHGSINWAQATEDDCRPWVEFKDATFPPTRDNRVIHRKGAIIVNSGRNLIIPSYLKDVSTNKLLLALWNQASEVIEKATEVIVVGFQLHPSDGLARHLLASAFLRNSRISKITIVSPKGPVNYWTDFCRKLGKIAVTYPMTFEEWVSKFTE